MADPLNTTTSPEPTCPACSGRGYITLADRYELVDRPCRTCGGSGRVVPERPPTPAPAFGSLREAGFHAAADELDRLRAVLDAAPVELLIEQVRLANLLGVNVREDIIDAAEAAVVAYRASQTPTERNQP